MTDGFEFGRHGDGSAAGRRGPGHRTRRPARCAALRGFRRPAPVGRVRRAPTRGAGPAGGRPAGEPDLQARFLQRLDLLRRTRLKPNGRKYTQQEIADGAGMSRYRRAPSSTATGAPPWSTATPSSASFRVHAGFLTAEDSEALVGALQRSEQELLQQLAERGKAAAAADDPLGSGCSRTTASAESPGGPRSCPYRPAPRQGRRMAGHALGERQAARVVIRENCGHRKGHALPVRLGRGALRPTGGTRRPVRRPVRRHEQTPRPSRPVPHHAFPPGTASGLWLDMADQDLVVIEERTAP